MDNLHVIDSTLAKYWLTKLRSRHTSAAEFRDACVRASSILAYESLTAIPTRQTAIETPLQPTVGFDLRYQIWVVPIERTGRWLVEGVLQMYPLARVCPIGLRRSANGTLMEYDMKLHTTDERLCCIVADGVVGSGRTMSRALEVCHNYWPEALCRTISFVGIEAGYEAVHRRYPSVHSYTLGCDKAADQRGYLLPGVGDIRRRAYNVDQVSVE